MLGNKSGNKSCSVFFFYFCFAQVEKMCLLWLPIDISEFIPVVIAIVYIYFPLSQRVMAELLQDEHICLPISVSLASLASKSKFGGLTIENDILQ